MEQLKMIAKELKEVSYPELNIENFCSAPDEERYQKFLNTVVFKNVDNPEVVKRQIVEKKISGRTDFTGVWIKGNEGICVIPKRETLYDEMIGIHEITHLVNYMTRHIVDGSVAKEVVPYFNEYEYLSRIHEFYQKYYEKYRFYNAIKASKEYCNKGNEDALSYLYAYLLLQKRKDSYNIKKLNNANVKKMSLSKSLKRKGYTLNL